MMALDAKKWNFRILSSQLIVQLQALRDNLPELDQELKLF